VFFFLWFFFRLSKQKQSEAKKAGDATVKVSEYEAREKAKMKKMLEGLGLASKYPMQ